ncbi:pyocin knob domain-containing protein, partial [Chelatococcus sp. XZ-Ab1]|uniref:pyocin knob domain-containing protein n=1 Tax=Chelatococcus sp. XZ-Ab1 TaxID=3034027 RepID=UPI0023E36B04
IEDARFPSHLQAANVQAIIAGLAGKLDVAGGAIAGNLAVGGEFTYGKAKAISGTDLDALTTPGFYDGSNLANGPTGAGSTTWYFVQVQRHSNPGLYVEQIATALNHSNGASWKRLCVNGDWQPWRQMWDAQTFDPASKLNMSGGNLTGPLLATDRLVAQATANGNAHVWLRNAAGKNRGLVYWDRNSGAVSLRVYADDGNGNDVAVGSLVLHADGTLSFNNNTVWHAGHKATAAQFRAGTTNTVLTSDGVWAAAGYVGLSGAGGSTLAAGTYAPNFGAGLNFHNVLAGNITIGNPSNAKAGQTGLIVLQQDATGGRTVAFGSAWRFANGNAPSMNTGASRTNVVAYQVLHSGFVIGSSIAGLV